MKIRNCIIAWILAFLPIGINAQQAASNVSAYQDGKTIIITYDLNETSDVSVLGNGAEPVLIKSVSGDVGKRIKAGKDKRIVWDVLKDYDKFIQSDVSFEVKTTPAMKTFILAEGAYGFAPDWGIGIMAGQVRKVGWFVKARTNFQFKALQKTKYQTDANGFVDVTPLIRPFYTGKKTTTELMIDGGIMVRLGCPLYLYAGGGLGLRKVLWETTNHEWVEYTKGSIIGFSADLGLMGCIKGFLISLGVNTIHFKYTELEFGLGWMF